MIISIPKTEVMQVDEQGRVDVATKAELKSVCKFACPQADCSRVFFNAHGCKCHAGKCKHKDFHVIEKILAIYQPKIHTHPQPSHNYFMKSFFKLNNTEINHR